MRRKKRKKRYQWTYGDEFNKWVTCLNCGEEYFIESSELDSFCPVCGSKEYEDSTYIPNTDWEDLL